MGGINIPQNEGKKFEADLKSSVPDTCWLYRLRDNASSFANGTNTRFTSSNICDFILFDDMSKTLFLLECKSTKGTSVSLSMLRDNQIKGLKEADVSIGFLGGNIREGVYFLMIFRILVGSVWYWNFPSTLAVRNSEVSRS